MPTSTTEAIILKRKNFGEADRILTVLTPYKGKISVMAKGVRKITSRRGGSIEPLNRVKLTIFTGKGMGILTEAESIETFPSIKSDLSISSYASHIIELVDRLAPENQLNPGVYKLVLTVLTLMEHNPRQLWIRAFEIKILSELGFWSDSQIQTSQELKDLMYEILNRRFEDLDHIKLSAEKALELERVLRYYIERVLESPLRSLKVIEKLKN